MTNQIYEEIDDQKEALDITHLRVKYFKPERNNDGSVYYYKLYLHDKINDKGVVVSVNMKLLIKLLHDIIQEVDQNVF